MPTLDTERKWWVLAVFLAWLVPGLGHWYLGRRGKGAVFCVVILTLFISGLALAQWKVVVLNDLLFFGQVLTGLVSFGALHVGNVLRQQSGPPSPVPVAFEMGTLYTLVAGLLNLLTVLDAYLVANGIRRSTHEKPEQEEAESE